MKLNRSDEGVDDLKNAALKDPLNATYQVDFLLTRDKEVDTLLKRAEELRGQGEIDAARVVYGRVLKMDGSNPKAINGLEGLKQDGRYLRLLTDGEDYLNKQKYELAIDRAVQVLDDFPKNQRALKLRDAVLDAQTQAEASLFNERAARYILDTPVTLRFNDVPIRSIFDLLSRSAGLNILFDRDVKLDNKASIYVKDVSVSDAVDLILMQNQLRKRVINGNTMIIYPANQSKRDEYEDLMIKTIQVTNTDIKYVTGLLKNMLKLKDIAADERTGILVIRDTSETLRMAERLIAAVDVPDPEIMLEVKVLEIASGRESNLGLEPPTSITVRTPSTVVGASSLTLGAFQNLTRDALTMTPLSATLNLKLQDTDTKLLASPSIRARNKETAKIMIGDRVPTVTNTVTPVATGTPVVTGHVTYQDVGLKLEVEPQVYANNEVGIKIGLEVSNIAKEFIDANGGRSYQIGTRNAATNLRLKDGETQILGGLITDEDRNTASKIPGLGHLPIIGRLFGNNAGTANRSEIVLAITPHIIRNLATREPNIKSIFSGTLANPHELPILADPVAGLKTTGTFGAVTPAVSTPTATDAGNKLNGVNSSMLINPASVAKPKSSTPLAPAFQPTGMPPAQSRTPVPAVLPTQQKD